jgi:hypothetical protein
MTMDCLSHLKQMVLGGCLLFSAPAMAAGQGALGTFVTPTRSGAVKFVAVKRVVQINGYQGNMIIAGRTFPGVMYGLRDGSGRVGFVWYYPSDYAQAGQAVLSLLPDGTYSGPMDFMNHRGAITESGTMTVKVIF